MSSHPATRAPYAGLRILWDGPRLPVVVGTEAHREVQKGYYGVLSLPFRPLAENRGPNPHNVAACSDCIFKVCTHSHTEQ